MGIDRADREQVITDKVQASFAGAPSARTLVTQVFAAGDR
jgi:hypothetical protein